MPERGKPPAVFLMGPTASSKTDLAVALVERLPLEIISVDSALVYRGMDIGTAKPDADTLRRAPHHLIDMCDPTEPYSAARFRDDALRHMAEITASGRVPLLVGGTMLYFRALAKGLSPLPEADPAVRAALEAELAEKGLAHMHGRLQTCDPEAAGRIHPNDPQRIQRALEVFALTGRPLSRLQAEGRGEEFSYRLLRLVRAPADRADLHQRIALRFERMLEQGFEREVRGLLDRFDLNEQLPSMRAVGYRQMLKYVAGDYTYEEMRQRGIIATRQLAKRQFTWLRSEPQAVWLDEQADPEGEALRRIGDFLW